MVFAAIGSTVATTYIIHALWGILHIMQTACCLLNAIDRDNRTGEAQIIGQFRTLVESNLRDITCPFLLLPPIGTHGRCTTRRRIEWVYTYRRLHLIRIRIIRIIA